MLYRRRPSRKSYARRESSRRLRYNDMKEAALNLAGQLLYGGLQVVRAGRKRIAPCDAGGCRLDLDGYASLLRGARLRQPSDAAGQ